jgi:8-oxo-dGTP pyrophosphatase MutT (NUDIX family)
MSKIKNASIIVVTGRNYDRVLMVRDKKNKKWMFPGGKIDSREQPWNAAKREFKEETGFDLPQLNGDNVTRNLYEFIKTHKDKTQTKIYLGFASSFDRNDLHNKYNIHKVKDNETDEAYSVCFSSLKKNKFHHWRSSKHSGQQLLRSAEERSMIEMYNSNKPIGEILRQITDRADNRGCGSGAQKQAVRLNVGKAQQPAGKCFGGRRKKTRRRKTKRRKTKRRKNKKRKKTRRRKHR